MKGLFIISELKWMRLWASPIEICTALFVLLIALMSVTSNVRETLDVSIPHGVPGVMRVDLKALADQFTIGERNIIPLSIRKLIPSSVPTYALVLWVLVLYLSKHYFENILGIHEELMLAAIIFTFISLFMLILRIRSML